MKRITLSLVIMLLITGALFAQETLDIRAAGLDLLGALNGDWEKFDRGMRVLDALLEKTPDDPRVKVLHGNGTFARSGQAFEKGDVQSAMKLWQSSMNEMDQAVKMAPNDVFVRARRGVMLISASRASSIPPAMAKPLIESAVSDFEKVLEIRESEPSLGERSNHQRGEVLAGIADGWNRLGNPDKARVYFERITRDLKGTIYEQRARAWLEDRPEAKAVDYFACSGCHIEK